MGHVFDEGLSLRKIQRGVEIMLWARHQESILWSLLGYVKATSILLG